MNKKCVYCLLVVSNFESDDLLKVVLDPLHLILNLQVGLRLFKIVPNDCSCPKTWGFLHVQKQSYIFGYPERHDFSDFFFVFFLFVFL